MAQSLKEARKGIRTKEGLEMAKKNFQMDPKKADLDKDGKLSEYEKTRGEPVQRAMAEDELPEMAHRGMACRVGFLSGIIYDVALLLRILQSV